MEFEPIDRHSGFASAVFVTRCLSSVLLVICTIFGLRTFKSWLRKYVILKALPGPDDTFPPLYLIKLILHNSRDENRTKGEVIGDYQNRSESSKYESTNVDPEGRYLDIRLHFEAVKRLASSPCGARSF